MDFSFSDLNFNSVETLLGYQARAAFTVNSASVFREDVDIVPTIVDDTLSYIPWGSVILFANISQTLYECKYNEYYSVNNDFSY